MALVLPVLVPSASIRVPPLVGTLQPGPKPPLMLTSNLPPPRLCTRLQSERIPKLPLRNPLTAPVPVGDLITIRPPRTTSLPTTVRIITPGYKSKKKDLFHSTTQGELNAPQQNNASLTQTSHNHKPLPLVHRSTCRRRKNTLMATPNLRPNRPETNLHPTHGRKSISSTTRTRNKTRQANNSSYPKQG